jgi:ferredoxin, 2Fe-2S
MSAQEITIHITDQVGQTHNLPALTGWRLMEIIRDSGLNMRAECGGSGACATCHVHLAKPWANKVTPPNDDEESALDTVANYKPHQSRLACQIILAQAHDRLEATLTQDCAV